MTNNCPGCRSENSFCFEHQTNEKAVYESGMDHDTIEYQEAIAAARLKDLRG